MESQLASRSKHASHTICPFPYLAPSGQHANVSRSVVLGPLIMSPWPILIDQALAYLVCMPKIALPYVVATLCQVQLSLPRIVTLIIGQLYPQYLDLIHASSGHPRLILSSDQTQPTSQPRSQVSQAQAQLSLCPSQSSDERNILLSLNFEIRLRWHKSRQKIKDHVANTYKLNFLNRKLKMTFLLDCKLLVTRYWVEVSPLSTRGSQPK